MISHFIIRLLIILAFVSASQGDTMEFNNNVMIQEEQKELCIVEYLTGEDIWQAAALLSESLKTKTFQGILAVARGGLIPSGLIAQTLDIRRIETICLKSYTDERSQSEIKQLNSPPTDMGDGTGWLVIDDLADSGATLRYIRKLYPNATFVTLYVKPKGLDTVDFYAKEYPQTTWVHFPWEPKIN